MIRFRWFCYLTFLISLSSAITAQPRNINQERITLRLENRPMKEVLAMVEREAGLHFVYDREVVPEDKLVSVTATNQTVKEVLEKVLQNTPTTFQQVGQNIIISRKVGAVRPAFGTLQGYVKDGRTTGALPGTSVRILGSATLATYSDGDGFYRINSVPQGTYDIVFSGIGYRADTLEKVNVSGSRITELNARLSESRETLKEVTVQGQRYMNTTREVGMVSEIKSSSAVITGISNAQITRSLDRDASDIIRRVSSATVVNDRFVLLRGLDPRYTLTMLNDFIAPSSETDTRDFSFDMIQSNVIDRITIYKSPVPELPADYVGGVVKIYTKNTATARQVQVQLSTQYRTNTGFKDFFTYQGGKTDRLGFDNNFRPLPSNLPGFVDLPLQVNQSPYFGSRGLWEATQKGSWNLQRQTANLDKRANVNYYDSWELGKKGLRLNNLTSLAYTFTRQNQYIDGAYLPFGTIGNYRRDTLSTEGVRISGMQNFRLVFNERHSVNFNNFINQISDDNTLLRIRNGGGGDDIEKNYSKVVQYRYRSRLLYTGQLAGNHRLGNTSLQWRTGYGYTREQIPNYRGIGMGRRLGSDSLQYLTGVNDFQGTGGFAYWHELKERTYTGAIDYEIPLFKSISLKTGLYGEYKDRTFLPRIFGVVPLENAPGLVPGNVFSQLDQYLTAANFTTTRQGDTNPGYMFLRDDSGGGTLGYTAQNRQAAFYAALNIPLFSDRLTVYGGLRVEYNNQRLQSKTVSYEFDENGNQVQGKIGSLNRDSVGTDWLPSVNLTYRLTPKMQLRGGYGYTVNRPVFREVANWAFYDPTANAQVTGNRGLYQARALNVDFRWEWYLSNRELLSIGTFYKYMVDPIERYADANTQGASFIPINSRDVKAYGLEFELRKNFGFLGEGFFKNLSVITNFSWIYTHTRAARNVVGNVDLGNRFVPASKDARPLVGTSPYILNAGLYYDNDATGTQVSLLYNTAGQRLTFAGSPISVGEIYELPRQVIDLVFTQRITPFMSVKVGVQDLLNQAFRFYRDVNRNGHYDPAEYNLTQLAIQQGEKLGADVQLPAKGIVLIPEVEKIDYLEYTYRPGSYYNFGINFTF